jgi:hypothetical protein
MGSGKWVDVVVVGIERELGEFERQVRLPNKLDSFLWQRKECRIRNGLELPSGDEFPSL